MDQKEWVELREEKGSFQSILRLLTDFDEQTGRYRRFGDPQTHFMRRALAVAEPEQLRIFLKRIGLYVYHVVVECIGPGGAVSTGWVHEDGIRAEREELSDQSAHPVHGILCLTDLYERADPLGEELCDLGINEATFMLLEREEGEPAV